MKVKEKQNRKKKHKKIVKENIYKEIDVMFLDKEKKKWKKMKKKKLIENIKL